MSQNRELSSEDVLWINTCIRVNAAAELEEVERLQGDSASPRQIQRAQAALEAKKNRNFETVWISNNCRLGDCAEEGSSNDSRGMGCT